MTSKYIYAPQEMSDCTECSKIAKYAKSRTKH